VETAIVMPFFVFLILGLLQLGLMHQARVLAKYAAYKAVRVGAIHNAKMSAMKKAALAVMLPMTGRRETDSYYNATPGSFAASYASAKDKIGNHDDPNDVLDITICEPKNTVKGDFDDPTSGMGVESGNAPAVDIPEEGGDDPAPAGPGGAPKSDPNADWQQFNAGRLSIQVTLYHQMVIPFANTILWHIVAGQEQAETMRVLRMLPSDDMSKNKFSGAGTISTTRNLADSKQQFIMPIRASWSMRMQSNFLSGSDFALPASNKCRVSWK
jgi:hypothetical protein